MELRSTLKSLHKSTSSVIMLTAYKITKHHNMAAIFDGAQPSVPIGEIPLGTLKTLRIKAKPNKRSPRTIKAQADWAEAIIYAVDCLTLAGCTKAPGSVRLSSRTRLRPRYRRGALVDAPLPCLPCQRRTPRRQTRCQANQASSQRVHHHQQ